MQGLLLGLAASHAGTADSSASRTLFLHLPARVRAAGPDLDIPGATQAAALAGLGLLYRGTAHRAMTELALAELERTATGRAGAAPGPGTRADAGHHQPLPLPAEVGPDRGGGCEAGATQAPTLRPVLLRTRRIVRRWPWQPAWRWASCTWERARRARTWEPGAWTCRRA